MKIIKRQATATIAFHKPEMVVDHLCSVFPHINPYLALIGRVGATELLEPESLNAGRGYISHDYFKSEASKAAYAFVAQAAWSNPEEQYSLVQLSMAYLRLRHSEKHRLDKTYEHYICCQIGRAIISNKIFRIKLQSQSRQLKQELSDFEQLLNNKFQCTLDEISVVAVNGLRIGALHVQVNDSPYMACSLCDSTLRLSVNSSTTITATKTANFISRLSTIERVKSSGKSATVVDGKVYELEMIEDSVEDINICSYSHIYQLIESSNNILIGNPYFGPSLEFAVGYLVNEKGILD